MSTVYVSIGNSDDKLTQARWANFLADVGLAIRAHDADVHGEWTSLPHVEWQNACWAFDIAPAHVDRLKGALSKMARRYDQDSIAWAEATTTFLTPPAGDAS